MNLEVHMTDRVCQIRTSSGVERVCSRITSSSLVVGPGVGVKDRTEAHAGLHPEVGSVQHLLP